MGKIQNPGQLLILLAGGLVLFCGAILFCFDPTQYHFYPTCIFHQVTGLLCPGCGSLRALHQLLHGHPVVAFQFNPLLVAALPLLAAFGLWHRLGKPRSQPDPWRRFYPLWILGILCLLFSVWRNLPGAPALIVPPG